MNLESPNQRVACSAAPQVMLEVEWDFVLRVAGGSQRRPKSRTEYSNTQNRKGTKEHRRRGRTNNEMENSTLHTNNLRREVRLRNLSQQMLISTDLQCCRAFLLLLRAAIKGNWTAYGVFAFLCRVCAALTLCLPRLCRQQSAHA